MAGAVTEVVAFLLVALDVLWRIAIVGLASGAAVQVVKLPIRVLLLAREQFPAEGSPWRSVWRQSLRTLAVMIGAAWGFGLPLWPVGLDAWGPLFGLVGGASASALYDAWFRLIASSPELIDDVARARLGGKAPARPPRRGRSRPPEPTPLRDTAPRVPAATGPDDESEMP